MEIGAGRVVVAMADKKENGDLRILGGGEAATRGLEKGEIVHAGDLAESIAQAVAKAEESSGLEITKLYFNLDDSRIESAWSTGSRLLDGEGEIGPADVRAAVREAERLAGDFEKKIVYSAEIDYVIDQKDPVADPVGVFGHKLEVKVHLLLARAGRWDAWRRLVRRAGLPESAPALSGLSSAFGVLNPEERRGRRILWDIGGDYWNGLVMDGGRIREYRTLVCEENGWDSLSGVLPALCQDFQKKYPGIAEIALTGESAADERILLELKNGLECPVRIAAPWGTAKLNDPAHASLAGLLRLAGDLERKSAMVRPEKSTIAGARQKVRSFFSDYF